MLDKNEALDIIDAIKVNLADVRELADRLYFGQGWLALGYESWPALVAAEIRAYMPALDREERRAVVADLAARGMSTRAIAPLVGASVMTVSNDRAASVQNCTVVGLDGRTTNPSRAAARAKYDADTAKYLRAREHLRKALELLEDIGVQLNYDRMNNAFNRAIEAWHTNSLQEIQNVATQD